MSPRDSLAAMFDGGGRTHPLRHANCGPSPAREVRDDRVQPRFGAHCPWQRSFGLTAYGEKQRGTTGHANVP